MSQSAPSAITWNAPHVLRRSVMVLDVVALLLALAVRLDAPSSRAPRLVGHVAPSFALAAEANCARLPGMVRLPARSGHPLLLVFSYSLCPRCLSVTTAAHDLQAREAGRGLGALYIDSPAETPGIADAYFQRLGVTAPILLDSNGSVAARYGIGYYPAVVLMDAQGTVRYVATGDTDPGALARALDALLSAKG